MLDPASRPNLAQSVLGLPAHTRDARGRRCIVFGLGFFGHSRGDVDLSRAEFQRLRHLVALKAGTATTGEVAGRIYAAAIAFLVAFFVLTRSSWMGLGLVAGAVFVVLGVNHLFRGLTATRRMPPVRTEAVVTVLLREIRCPSCAHSLADLATEDDGCTVCPECGCAWRLHDTPYTRLPPQMTTSTGSPPNS